MEDIYRRRMPEVVLISGAAGGIGSATARRFAAEGCKVAVTDVSVRRGRRKSTGHGGQACQ